MGLAHSPSVVMNGLVAYLDAGNTKGFDNKENIITNSEFVYFQLSGSTVATANQPFVPYGRNTAVNFNNNGGAGVTYIYRDFNTSLASGTKYVISVFSDSPTLVLGQGGLAAGKFTQISSGSITLSNGWYRHWVSYSATVNSPNITPQVVIAQGVNVTLCGWQVETGEEITEYYQTGGTAKTRGTTFIDLSGNGNNGTLTNGPTYSSSNGGSLNYDGTNDYIQTPITGTFSQITFEFYGFFDDPNLNMLLRQESAFGDWTSNRVHFGTRWTGSNAGMHFNVNGVWQTTPPTYLRYGWNHYVLVYDTLNNLKRVYLNGILSSSHGTNGNMVLGDFKIGVATNLNAYYRGNISNFKIYNRALTAAEVAQNFNALRGRFGI